VDWVVKTGVRANATLEATSPTIYLAEQLDLEPTLVALDGVSWSQRSGKFSDSEEAHAADEVYKPLGNAHERADLPNCLQPASVYWCYASEFRV
jgi:hypothetical protein